MTTTEKIENAKTFKEIMDIVVNLPHDNDHDRYVLLAFLRYDEIRNDEIRKAEESKNG